MKTSIAVLCLSLALSAAAHAQSMKGMDMKGTDMKGTEKKDAKSAVHKGSGVITRVDKDKVTIRHDPIASLNWPTMTMAFTVKDKALMQRMAKDKRVQFEFVQQASDFVITSVK